MEPREGDALARAAASTRFVLHTMLLGSDIEGCELAAEAMGELQEALVAYHGGAENVPPICSGCSPIRPFEERRHAAT